MSTLVIYTDNIDILNHHHINDMEIARKKGDCLVVIVKNDVQMYLIDDFAYPLTKEQDRLEIIRRLPFVDFAYLAKDTNISIAETIDEIVKNSADVMPDKIELYAPSLTFQDERLCEKYGIKTYISNRCL